MKLVHVLRGIGASLLLLPILAPRASADPVQEGRVVVLGFDGADYRTVERLMAAGRLPNLAALAASGTFAPLRSTNPAESAAGWAAINTGRGPLENNVPGFLKRSEDGRIAAVPAHLEWGPARVEELDPGGWFGFYSRYPGWQIAGAAGGAALVLVFSLVRWLLRRRPTVAALVSVPVAVVAAWLALRPAQHVFASVPNVYRNKIAAEAFWDLAAEGGKRALVLEAALAFGRPETPGARVLAGLGVPDATGAMNGSWYVYTTDELAIARPPVGTTTQSLSGTVFRVDEKDGRVETQVYGPVNFTELAPLVDELASIDARLADGADDAKLRARRDQLIGERDAFMRDSARHHAALDLTLERRGAKLAITIDGSTQEVGEGEWTDWFRLPFELNPLVTVNAITRARVLSLDAPLSVYFNTFDIDPEAPPFWQPVSSPPGFSAELVRWSGAPYETLGWACMTNPMKDRALPVDVFLEDIEFTMRWRERLTTTCLARKDWDLLFSVFSTTDRVQHVMYRHYDEGHPRHDPGEAAREVPFFGRPTSLKEVIPAIYEQMDRIVGEVVARLAPDDQLFLCADHGFTSYRYGLQVNNWLAREGYLALRPPSGPGRASIVQAADWSRTRAYSLGLGMIYVNMRGREPGGIVPRGQAKALLREIGEKLLALTDPGPNEAPFASPRRVVLDYEIMDDTQRGGDARWGDAAWPCADMMIGLAEYYRASWESVDAMMRFEPGPQGQPVVGPNIRWNRSEWSGDHASSSPGLVTGVFFARRPVAVPADGAHVLHVAPTVLDALGVQAEGLARAPLPRK